MSHEIQVTKAKLVAPPMFAFGSYSLKLIMSISFYQELCTYLFYFFIIGNVKTFRCYPKVPTVLQLHGPESLQHRGPYGVVPGYNARRTLVHCSRLSRAPWPVWPEECVKTESNIIIINITS